MQRVLWFLIALAVFATTTPNRAGAQATPADEVSVADGFRAELLYTVPPDQGSWVSMTHDPKGRLIVSDQYGSLYRARIDGDDVGVEKLKLAIGHAQGLLCAFDSLYVVVNGRAAEGSGLYRLRDTNRDDQYDEVKLLRSIQGSGEHGPHAVILSPDGKSLYITGGNHTELPDPEESCVPRRWDEDQLLPRMWDAGGHAVGRMAPGGWICRTDPDGKTFELISNGYRNEYDIAFDQNGELFTFDADMEWDIGSPWYRPTRICHVTSGSEFGWRSGTGKWPAYYPDSLPAAVDIGPGSPTGICFGNGAAFPEKYQRALFIADWSFGVIYAVHLTPEGSSYTGTFEQFATASPLAVTDMTVRPQDGALYFTVGGRRTQSALYRITHGGDSSEAASRIPQEQFSEQRSLRHRLENFHGDVHADAVAAAWPYLEHPDRFVRYAARIAIEHQPVEQWQQRALDEQNPQALIEAMVALARCAAPEVKPKAIEALGRLDWDSLDEAQQLAALRIYGLLFIRLGEPSDATRLTVLERLDAQYPATSARLNRELSKMLIYLNSEDVVQRTLQLLSTAPTQEAQIDYVLALRTAKDGWTMDDRKEYFHWFRQAGQFHGGHSFSMFLDNIRQEAIDLLTGSEKEALADLLKDDTPVVVVSEPRAHVRRWTVSDLLPDLQSGLRGRDFSRGRQMFAAADCFKCHRFAGEGGIIGPDLTGVAKRFDSKYLLESLIEPSKAVSDQYQSTVFVLDNGKNVVGKVANLNGDSLMVITNMLEPGNMTGVRRGQIEEKLHSNVSMMPQGLLDTLKRDELLDLIAYLLSGGDPGHEAF